MCISCYHTEYGAPVALTEKALAAVPLIQAVYAAEGSGGNLHIVLDDWNIEDDSVAYCARRLAEGGHRSAGWPDDAYAQQLVVERTCVAAFSAMTVEERATALALHDGFITRDGDKTYKILDDDHGSGSGVGDWAEVDSLGS